MTLTIRLDREDDGRWIAIIDALPGVTLYGATPEAAIESVKAMALEVLADEIAHGERPGLTHIDFVLPRAEAA